MFETESTTPRLFGVSPGVDFPKAVVDGLIKRMDGQPPHMMARVTLVLNTSRMKRRVLDLFSTTGARFLPRILLLSGIDDLLEDYIAHPEINSLAQKLQLMQLVTPFADKQSYLAPQSSIYSLSTSLSALIEEMQGEGVDMSALQSLNVEDHSKHWDVSRRFIQIAHDFLAASGAALSPEARRRMIVKSLIAQWDRTAPNDPIIVAGSTASRGTTSELMKAVSKLANGAIILPGFDRNTPRELWQIEESGVMGEDHPQYRFANLMSELDITADQVEEWVDDSPPAPLRNRVISLALRPAPVTDAWLSEGPNLPDLRDALAGITLLNAPDPRSEALAIAMRLRQATEDQQTAALISPDRMLTRQVSAFLDRWGIEPDDSAGEPLHLSSPGRFLRHITDLFRTPLTAENLLVLLKHPLCHSTEEKDDHGLFVQLLEAKLRRDRVPFPDSERLKDLIAEAAQTLNDPTGMTAWGDWVCTTFADKLCAGDRPLADWVQAHMSLAERAAKGTGEAEAGKLWASNAGESANTCMTELRAAAPHGGVMSAFEYADLVSGVLSNAEVRDAQKPHPHVLIWGTMEARVQGADLVILGGLNEGSWPETATPDPWLNRAMRAEAGLLLPERRIGLAAHDFQQAAAAPDVWFARSVRSNDAETVPSRWINRITNLIEGLPDNHGPTALAEMTKRGDHWLEMAQLLDPPVDQKPARRPSPKPPVPARPNRISATEIKTLIRDPYAIYAKHCLRLNEQDSLVQEPDAAIRGTLIHEIMERFVTDVIADPDKLTAEHLMHVAANEFETSVPWPTMHALWLAKLRRISEVFVDKEKDRLRVAQPAALERTAQAVLRLTEAGTDIVARADRIDLGETGEAYLYDYKSGHVPTAPEQKAFDKQLLVQALMIEEGSFGTLGPKQVNSAIFLGVGSNYKECAAPLDDEPMAEFKANLVKLLLAYRSDELGYTSRSRMQKDTVPGRYDHLARLGEWEHTDDPNPEDVA